MASETSVKVSEERAAIRATARATRSKIVRRAITGRARLCAWLSACALLLVCFAACNRAGGTQTAAPTPQKSDFERKLDIVRRAPHIKIYVVRRKDSAPLSSDDKLFLRRNTPPEVATWVLTDDGTTAIAGANFDFEPKNFQALSKDFTVEDYTNK
ncbi:MAG: hypothetical protein M3268_02775 [Acidobacteriota bacterium]|nr:hypothetical protein [Acidobacteriota bacterium]